MAKVVFTVNGVLHPSCVLWCGECVGLLEGNKGMDEKSFIKSYVTWRCVLMKGHSEVSLVMSIVSPVLLVWLTLRDAVTIARIHALWIIPVLVIVAIIVQIIIGMIWDKKKLVEAEQSWLMKRTPEIQELLNKKEKPNEIHG